MNRRTGRALLALLAALVIASWYATADPTRPGLWVLGLYRTRWFLCSALLSWILVWAAVAVLARPSRKTWLRVGVAHLVVAAVLAGAEAAVARGWIDSSALRGPASGSPQREHRLRRVTFPHFEWEGAVSPNLQRFLGVPAAPVPVRVSTDAFGLRNPPGREAARILCLGDSLLFAWLVPREENVTERLGALLQQPVQNVSEPSYSPQEELIRLRMVHESLEGKLVVQFLFEGNDLADSRDWRRWCESPLVDPAPRDSLVATLWQRLKWPNPRAAADRAGNVALPGGPEERVYFLYERGQIASQMGEMPFVAEALREAARELTAEGARYAVVFLPMKLRVLHGFCRWPADSPLASAESATSPFAAAVSEVCAEAGIPFRDATPWLVEAAGEGRLPYFPLDTHLNACGHEVLAGNLAPWIEELLAGLDDPGTLSPSRADPAQMRRSSPRPCLARSRTGR